MPYDPRDADYVSAREECEFLIDRIESGTINQEDITTWVYRIAEKVTVELADAAKRGRESAVGNS